MPAWLWSVDGTRILWANPVGAGLFGAADAAALAEKIFGPADPHRRQVARLAGRLPPTGAIRLERLRGFGAALGALATCGCAAARFCRWQSRRPDRGRQHALIAPRRRGIACAPHGAAPLEGDRGAGRGLRR